MAIGEKHQRGADHPDKEDVGIGGIGLAAAHEDPQHLVVELDADFQTTPELPTVSIQNGRPICRVISAERIWSRIEKNGLGPGAGSGSGGRMSTFSCRRSWAMRMTSA